MDTSNNNTEEFKMYSTKCVASIAVVLVIGIVVGLAVSSYLPSSDNYKKGYQAGFDTAKSLVESSSIGKTIIKQEDVRFIVGTVTAVTSEKITIHTISNNPFDDSSLNDRIVAVSSSTLLVKLVQKDSALFQSEVDAFTEVMKAGTSTLIKIKPSDYPQPFIETKVTISDIRAGDALLVTTLTNIKSAKEFTASRIEIQSQSQYTPTQAAALPIIEVKK